MKKKFKKAPFFAILMLAIGIVPACDNSDDSKSIEGNDEVSLNNLVSYNVATGEKKNLDPKFMIAAKSMQKKYVTLSEPDTTEISLNSKSNMKNIDSKTELQVNTRASRIRVTNTTSPPYRTYVKLISYFPSGTAVYGSGTLVGYKHVLTSGRCIYESALGGYARSIQVIPGKSGPGTSIAEEPYGRTWAAILTTPDGWTINRNIDYDYGIITLSTSIGTKTGWHGYRYVDNDSEALNLSVTVNGYPTNLWLGNYLYRSADYIRQLDYFAFYSPASGSSGQYGGALRCNTTGYLIGIYTGNSYVDIGGGNFALYSRNLRLRKYIFDTINAVKAAFGD